MVQTISNPPRDAHIACCGLFCTNCGAFKKDRCKGCLIKPAFSRCAVRKCCIDKGILNCGQCDEFRAPRDYRECKKLYNFISRAMALLFKSDRIGALSLLRDKGVDAFVAAKRESGKM